MYIYWNSENEKNIFLHVIKIGTKKNLMSSVEREIVYVTENRRMRKYFNNISVTKQIVLARMCLEYNFFSVNIWQTTYFCTYTDLTSNIQIPLNQKLKSILSFWSFWS